MRNTDLRSRSFERILLIKPSAVGDVIHTIPVLVKLRARYPEAQIDWLITPENGELVRHHPGLSQTVLFPRREYARFGRSWSATLGPIRLLSRISKPRYDLVVDMHGQFRSALFTLASGAPVRIGFDRPRGSASAEISRHGWSGAREGAWVAYTHVIPIPTLDIHAIDRYLWLGPMLGFDDEPPDFRIYLAPQAGARVDRLLEPHQIGDRALAVLVPGTIWPTKHWHVEGFAEVGRRFLERGMAVAVAGTPRDRDRGRAIAAACPGVCDLTGQTTLAELAALIQRAAICITNDSGSMHLAVALNRPVVSVFGPTDPRKIGPYGRPHAVVRADVPCSPCYLRHLRDCKHDHVCMTSVTGAMVSERAEQILAASDV
ncbi:MAG TPA: glycosyltransferase family 9 protein [Isosphaeraceae bacterium]|nr:glycosyltransferase family 9 protein [Isosphaeraceae bacterium]